MRKSSTYSKETRKRGILNQENSGTEVGVRVSEKEADADGIAVSSKDKSTDDHALGKDESGFSLSSPKQKYR